MSNSKGSEFCNRFWFMKCFCKKQKNLYSQLFKTFIVKTHKRFEHVETTNKVNGVFIIFVELLKFLIAYFRLKCVFFDYF